MAKLESKDHYLVRVEKVKAKVLKMPEAKLNKALGKWKKRLISYDSSNWYLANASIKEVGVWNRAGELPLRWTNRSLEETAYKVKRALSLKNGFKHKKIRAAHAIPGILNTCVDILQDEKYLLPIVFKCDTGTQGRFHLKGKMKGDIEDGCMRSIALAVSGRKQIKVYFGVPKN